MSRHLAIWAFLVVLPCGPAFAEPPEGVFPATVTEGGLELELNGAGLCEWGVFSWDLYWGALYLEEPSSDARKITNAEMGKRVQLYFVRELTREQMVKAYTESFKINAKGQLPKYRKGLDQLTGMLTRMKKGDSLTFTYLPGSGLVVAINGKNRGTIAGPEFGRMFFKLYLGPKPPSASMKKAMLGSSRKKK